MTKENMIVVRSNKIEEGKRYFVQVHGTDGKWLTARKVPAVPLTKMTEKDEFVFSARAGAPELVLKTHGTGGPQFLVAKVKGKRGVEVNARVTFYEKEKNVTTEQEQAKKAA